MIPLSNAHTHTTYCHGAAEPEALVQAALQLNMVALGFSSHAYTPFDTSYCMSQQDTVAYIAQINALKKKYEGQIEILLGVEQDLYSQVYPPAFDYRIGSVHYLHHNGEYLPVDESEEGFVRLVKQHFGGDYYFCCRKYYEQVAALEDAIQPDFFAHLDLVTKFNKGNRFFDEEDKRYQMPALEALLTLLAAKKPFELNVGVVYQGMRSRPYPGPFLLQRIQQYGGSLILTSDAHDTRSLCYRFDEACALLRCFGFSEVATLRKEGIRYEKL